jgi:hypothetical protein
MSKRKRIPSDVLERDFQSKLVKELHSIFRGCVVLHNDAHYIQGIPDLIVLIGSKWFALEVKKSKNAKHRPNQDYYVSKMNEMSFARFIYPENKEEILNEIQRSL